MQGGIHYNKEKEEFYIPAGNYSLSFLEKLIEERNRDTYFLQYFNTAKWCWEDLGPIKTDPNIFLLQEALEIMIKKVGHINFHRIRLISKTGLIPWFADQDSPRWPPRGE